MIIKSRLLYVLCPSFPFFKIKLLMKFRRIDPTVQYTYKQSKYKYQNTPHIKTRY